MSTHNCNTLTSGITTTSTCFASSMENKVRFDQAQSETSSDEEENQFSNSQEPDLHLDKLAQEPFEFLAVDPPESFLSSKAAWKPMNLNIPTVRDLETGEELPLITDINTGEVFMHPRDLPKVSYKVPRANSTAWSDERWRQKRRESNERLWAAIELGTFEEMEIALMPPTDGRPPAQINATSAHGKSSLHLAASRDVPGFARLLLDRRADLHQRTHGGATAVHIASSGGHCDVVKFLLQQGAQCDPLDWEGNLPLHLAAANGHVNVVEVLMACGAPEHLRLRRNSGQCPRELAADVPTLMALQANAPEGIFDADSYASRSELAGVLRRSSRADHVRRLLHGHAAPPTEEEPQAAEEPEPTNLPEEQKPRGRQAPFTQINKHECEAVRPDDFKVERKLGKGAFGQVYLVKHKANHEEYAMKVLDRRKMKQSHVRFVVTERNVLSYIKHPYIVRLHYSFQAQTFLVLVLQFCNGGDIQGLLNREKRLPEPLAKLYTAEVLTALAHLHLRDIVYRDLKPENVLVDNESHAVLTDFGLSKENVVGLQGTRSFCGSLAFIAPEVLRQGSGHGRMVDIYGLGVFLYHMLAGMPPFYDRRREVLIRNIKEAPLRFPPIIPPPAQGFVSGLMKRDPTQRLGQQSTFEIQNEAYYDDLDFDKLMRREVPVPVTLSRPTVPESSGRAEKNAIVDSPFKPEENRRGKKEETKSPDMHGVSHFTFVNLQEEKQQSPPGSALAAQ
jgi:protein-serine/threonine kinase